MKPPDRITINPYIWRGNPTIRGLRINVDQIIKALAAFIKVRKKYDIP